MKNKELRRLSLQDLSVDRPTYRGYSGVKRQAHDELLQRVVLASQPANLGGACHRVEEQRPDVSLIVARSTPTRAPSTKSSRGIACTFAS